MHLIESLAYVENLMTVNEKKSPLREKPLHYPGQSLDEQLDHIKKDMMTFGLVLLFFVAVAVLEC